MQVYAAVNCVFRTICLASLLSFFQSVGSAADRYGGIEIGAKGVKFAAIEVDGNSIKEVSVPKDIVNVTIARLEGQKFDQWKIDDVASVVKSAKEAMVSKLGIPESNIRVVASSGVPSFASNQQDLVDAILNQTGLTLEKIGPTEEASLTNLALIPAARRGDTMVVDVGSGNTKGGAFQNGSGLLKDFVPIDVKFGTASFARKIDEEVKSANRSAIEVGPEIARVEIGESLIGQMRLSPVLSQRKNVLFSGGSVWAMTTIVKPEKALQPFPQITASDISNYKQIIASSLPSYPKIDFSRIQDPAVRAAAKADFDRITGNGGSAIFKPEELFAGAMLLEEVSRAMQFQTRAVMFDRKATTAWITAYITPESLRDKLPDALGRKLSPVTAAVTPSPSTAQSGSQDTVNSPEAKPKSPGASTPPAVAQTPSVPKTSSSQPVELPLANESNGTGMPVDGISSMQLVEVWENETIYETRTVCCWVGPLRGWQSFCECVPVTRSVCRMQWQPVSIPSDCGCQAPGPVYPSQALLTKSLSKSTDGFRNWVNGKGVVSKIRMRASLVSNGWVVFETEAKRLLTYPIDRLSQSDRNALARQADLLRLEKQVVDSSGKFGSRLTFVSVHDDSVIYLKANGRLIFVPMDRLSNQDRQLAQKQRSSTETYVALKD